MNEISPRLLLERLFRRWYLIALGVLLGGILAYVAARLLPPVYEAHADLYINLDSALFAQEDPPGESVELALADAVRPITALFYSDEVVLGLIDLAAEEGILLDQETVFNDFSIQRLNLTWQMTVRATSPDRAARLADLWVQMGLLIHQPAHDHAMQAYALSLERDALAACFDDATFAQGNTCAGTSLAAPGGLEETLVQMDAAIAEERLASMGLDPAMTLEALTPAEVPASPVRYPRTWLLLAGALIGLLGGMTVSQLPFPMRKNHEHKN